jgi:hypothetical protein
MAKNKDIESGARIVAEDFKLPGGRRKAVAKLVKDHLSWFDVAKARGMAVEDILSLLTSAGATYEDGSSINFDTLSNALWRKRNSSSIEPTKIEKTPPRRPNKIASGRVVEPTDMHRPAAKRRPRLPVHSTDHNRPAKPGGDLVTSEVPGKRPHSRVQGEKPKASSADVLGFMRRAAAIRRPRGERD